MFQLKGHKDEILSVAFSPDGKRIVSGCADGSIRIWDSIMSRENVQLGKNKTNNNIKKPGTPYQIYPVDISLFPNLNSLIMADGNNIKSINISTTRTTSTLDNFFLTKPSYAFSSDGNYIVMINNQADDTTAWICRYFNYNEQITIKRIRLLKGHTQPISYVTFSPNNKIILTGCRDGAIRLWNIFTGKEIFQLKGHKGFVISATFSPDGNRLITSSGFDFTARIWDTTNGNEILKLNTIKDRGVINCSAFSPDGKLILTGDNYKTASVWNSLTGKRIFQLHGHNSSIVSVAFSPDGKRIVTGGYDKTIRIWDSTTGRELLQLKGNSEGINSTIFSHNGNQILTGYLDGTACIWQRMTDAQVAEAERRQEEEERLQWLEVQKAPR